MNTERIIKILSNHRQPHSPEHPQALTVRSIVSLVEHSLSPDETVTSEEIRQYLQELQAQGEVLAGLGNRFCMAPPIVLAENKTNVTEVLFRGDRAYLRLAHKALETGQPITRIEIRPRRGYDFDRIQQCLNNYGIRLLKVTDSIDHLPEPGRPQLHLLVGVDWQDNPLQFGSIQAYLPSSIWQRQSDRWQFINQTDLRSDSLLKLSTGEYLWFDSDKFYELSPDTATLAMFWLDQQAGLPLQVPWDEIPGRLNLQGISLPTAYAQWLWRLSQPDQDQPRIRLFAPSPQRLIVCQALIRLGCSLV